jgi:hypothetical protein
MLSARQRYASNHSGGGGGEREFDLLVLATDTANSQQRSVSLAIQTSIEGALC